MFNQGMAVNHDKLWTILQGLPISSDGVKAELSLAYNCMVTALRQTDNNADQQALYQLHTTLSRALGYLNKDVKSKSVEFGDCVQTEKLCALFHQCLAKADDDLMLILCLLAVVVTMHKGHDGYLPTAKKLLLACLTHLSNVKHHTVTVEVKYLGSGKILELVPCEPEGGRLEDCMSLLSMVKVILTLISVGEGDYKASTNYISHLLGSESLSRIKPYVLYMKAMSKYKEGLKDEARVTLEEWRSLPDIASSCSSQLWNLCGCLLASQKQPHSAVQLYKESLQADFDNILPMYNTALQYRELGKAESELETLNLLLTALRQKEARSSPAVKKRPLCISASTDGIKVRALDSLSEDISTEEALYALANRCLQLNRYEVGAVKYLELLSMLTSTSRLQSSSSSGRVVKMPAISNIFLECALCQLHAGMYKDCVVVCDRLIDSYNMAKIKPHTNKNKTNSENYDIVASKTSGFEKQDITDGLKKLGKKRLHSDDSEAGSCGVLQEPGVTSHEQAAPDLRALLVKADAHVMLAQPTEALLCLDRLIEKLQLFGLNSEIGPVDQLETFAKPKRKRTRFELEDEQVVRDLSDAVRSSPLSLLCECYSKRAIVLTSTNQLSDAISSSRTAVLMAPGNVWLLYNHCLLLHRLRRHTEAATTWLDQRGMTGPLDAFQISTLLQKKTQAYQHVGTASLYLLPSLQERDLLALDIASLNALVNRNKQPVRPIS